MDDAARRTLREKIEQRMLQAGGLELPSGSLQRWAKAALAGLRGGRLAWRLRGGDPALLDAEELVKMVASVGQLKGVTMKLGQLLSYVEAPLPEDLRAALSALQTGAPPMPFSRVAEIVREDLGDAAPELLATMSERPAAAASIGQVHLARLSSGAEVAIKVRYDEIERAIASDFRPAVAGTFLGSFLPGSNLHDTLSEASRAVLAECDYRRESEFQERFAAAYATHPTIVVPAIERRFCGPRVLTASWAEGLRFDDWLAREPSRAERDRIGAALFELYLGSVYRHRIHNWDPHPGNYVFRDDGKLAVLDYGAAREVPAAYVQKLADLNVAFHEGREAPLHDALSALGMPRPKGSYNFAATRALLEMFYGPTSADESRPIAPITRPFGALVKDKQQAFDLRLPAELLFFLRTRFALISVLAKVGAELNWYRLELSFAERIEPSRE